ncbi:AAA family ATPase [Paragemmobacter aquarius]|uniref:AAA family ATPase n=1 Tax=Paragemmobacter aquarius TaxID=2169400 RepID=UPI00131F3D4E|nr:hypothetical protein [Gemmobacter aquarius]
MTLFSNDFIKFDTALFAPLPALTLAAFTLTPESASALRQVQASRLMARVAMTVQNGGMAAAMSACGAGGAPQLLVIETDAAMEPLLAQIDALAELCEPETRLLVIGGSNDIALYRALLRQGVSDYLPRPVRADQVLRCLSDITAAPGAVAKGAVTACLGTSGGTGSSSVALGLGWMMGQSRQGVASLLDLDLDFGTAGLSLALDGTHGIAEALAAGTGLDAQLLDGLFDGYDTHLRVLTASDAAALAADPAPAVLDHLTDLVRTGGQPVVLDLPPFGCNVTRHAVISADHVVLTTMPDLAGLRNTRKLLDLIAALRPDEPAPMVVLNRLGMARRQEITAKDFARTLGITLAATLPFDPKAFAQATNRGKVLVSTPAGKAVSRGLRPLVRALSGPLAAAKPAGKPLLARLFRRG